MAFQVGTRVRPELGNADYSGFVRAAEIQANTLAQLGSAIGGAIQDHQAKKAKKLEEQVSLNALKSLYPQLDDDTAKAVIRNETVRDLFKSTLSQQEDPTTSTQMISISNMLQRPEFKDIKFDETGQAFMEVPNKDTLIPFDKKRVPVPEEIKNIPGFEDYAASRRTVPVVDDNDPMGILR
tara:strand:- start:2 stop:544 length:543 start_codon:yes stop_codon:yes gene_type:complete